MPKLSQCLDNFAPSQISEIYNLAIRLKAEGRTIYNLSSGEPDFDTDPVACAAAHAAIDGGYTKYTEIDGSPALKAAIRRKLVRDGHPAHADAQIIVGNGAKPLLHNIFMTLLNPGDEVVLPTPCWTSHMGMLQVLGAQVKTVECTLVNDFKPRPEDLRAAITEKTRLLILCSPANPTGALLNESDLRAIANIMTEHPNVWIVSDEIYSDIIFDSHRHASFAVVAPQLADRIITVNGMSKGYAMTGWRIGYAAGPTQAITGTRNLMSQITGSPSSIGQAAAIAALDGPQEPILRRNAEYQSRRDMVCGYLSQVPELVISKPAGAFYVFVDSAGAVGKKTPAGDTISSSADLTRYFLERAGVAVVPGEAFASPNSFRLSFATSPDILEGACQGIIQSCKDLL